MSLPLLFVALLAVLPLVLSSPAVSSPGPPRTYFKYFTTSSCNDTRSGNIADMLDFAINNPPWNGQCTQCVSRCAPRQSNLSHPPQHLASIHPLPVSIEHHWLTVLLCCVRLTVCLLSSVQVRLPHQQQQRHVHHVRLQRRRTMQRYQHRLATHRHLTHRHTQLHTRHVHLRTQWHRHQPLVHYWDDWGWQW